MKRSGIWRWVLVAVVVLLIVIQFVPAAEADNPPVEEVVPAPAEVMAVLETSCYDCHSNETEWPWYSHVAPMKWLVRNDVADGRRHLNFSTWNRYDAEERADLLEEIGEEVREGKMPLWFYPPLHPGADVTEGELALLEAWVAGMGVASEMATTGGASAE